VNALCALQRSGVNKPAKLFLLVAKFVSFKVDKLGGHNVMFLLHVGKLSKKLRQLASFLDYAWGREMLIDFI